MGLKSTKILGISVTTESKKSILEYIEKYLEEAISDTRKVIRVVTPNPEQIVRAQKDPHFAKILNQADVALPDGIGLVAAIRLRNFRFQISNLKLKIKRIHGVDFMEDLVGLAAKQGYPIGLIGGRGGVAVEALECLKAQYPELVGWAMEPEDGEFLEKIKKTNTRIVFVGLGAPKQEFFMEQLVLSLRAKRSNLYQNGIATSARRSVGPPRNDGVILMSVGGSFDILARRVPRAPFLIRSLGLEWLWRLGRQPWRLGRQLALLRFIFLVLAEKSRL